MDIDLMIQNQMKRSPMESAMHSVASDLGNGHYQLSAHYQSESEATELLGTPIAKVSPSALFVRPPTQTRETNEIASFTQSVGDYSISYDSNSQTWTLNKLTTMNGMKSFWANLTGNSNQEPQVLFSKSGPNSTNRFLTTIEESSMSAKEKSQFVQVVVGKTDNTGISEYVGGQVVYSSIDNMQQSDLASILNAEYVKPRPLNGYTPVLNELGERFGTHTGPQTLTPGTTQLPIRSNDFQTF
jgi:hypothetical protein